MTNLKGHIPNYRPGFGLKSAEGWGEGLLGAPMTLVFLAMALTTPLT